MADASTTEEPVRAAAAGPQEYGHIHRLVLQGLMSAGCLDAKGVKRLFVGACSYLNREQRFEFSFWPAKQKAMSFSFTLSPLYY
jgi:hypothetical protein